MKSRDELIDEFAEKMKARFNEFEDTQKGWANIKTGYALDQISNNIDDFWMERDPKHFIDGANYFFMLFLSETNNAELNGNDK